VPWHKVIKSKSFGDLELGSLHDKNLALLFKWLWNLDKGVEEVGKISSFENISLILQMDFICLQVRYLQLGMAWYQRFPQIKA
jgi:hypothetical protein